MNSVNKSLVKNIFHTMLRIRMVEEEIAARYSQQQMRCPTHLSIGQEAVAGVVGAFLKREDLVVSTHRAHAHYLAKGGGLPALIAELHGRVTGCTRGRGGSMNLTDREAGFVASTAIVGNTIPIGVGLALAQLLKKTDNIVVVYFGDAAVEEGAYYEALSFAALKKLPVLFICENNLYSVNTALELRQPAERKIYEMSRAIGVKSDSLDGNDALGMLPSVQNVISKVRRGDGPWLLELSTYRFKTHCGPEDDLADGPGARPHEEIEQWLKRDPVLILESQLLSETIVKNEELEQWKKDIKAEIDAAFDYALASDYPDLEDCFNEKYAKVNTTWLQKILSKQEEVTFNG
jgi:TPP-dependent pyruvate/acetoin dehydrogenase alpha subunit